MSYIRSTNFFQRQAQARKSCRNLIILFILAVLLIAIIMSFALRLIWILFVAHQAFLPYSGSQYYYHKLHDFIFFDPVSFFLIALAVILFILIASWIKTIHLQKGGGEIALMLGGRLLINHTDDPAERQLLNVVEEMAIASGIPVPLVFVLDNERSINAFAAGFTLYDAAIAVTSGTLDQLTRDELQGVIAHEFSHILNGDMRLNIQMIGILYGILVIGIIGSEIIEHRNITGKTGIVLITAGILLGIIGYIGTFMGRLIQSAVSRHKEYLADASAVQFTRNPMGLASALKKIGGYVRGSRINSAKAKQARHLFFSESHPDELFPFLDTHPPLEDRIRLLEPTFDGKFTKIKAAEPLPVTPFIATKPADIINRVGNPSKDDFGHSLALLALIPGQIRQALNTPQGSATVICALLLGNNCNEKATQLNALQRAIALHGNVEETTRFCDLINNLPQDIRLPLVEIAMPSLRSLTGMEKRNFLIVINALIMADNKVTLFEFTVQWMINKLLSDTEDISSKVTFFSYSPIGLDILIILSALACAGNIGNEGKARLAFIAGVERIPELASKKPDFSYEQNIAFLKVGSALKQLNYASFKIKQSVIDACAHCAFSDQTITVSEADLLRVISLALSCPLPPFLPVN